MLALEAQALADRVAVIADGRIVADGTPESLGGRSTAATVVSFRLDGSNLDGFPVGDAAMTDEGRVTIRTQTPTRTVHDVTGWAVGRGIELEDLAITRPSLEDVYLELTGEASGG